MSKNTIESPLEIQRHFNNEWVLSKKLPDEITELEVVDLSYAKELQAELKIMTDGFNASVEQFNKQVAVNKELKDKVERMERVIEGIENTMQKTYFGSSHAKLEAVESILTAYKNGK